MVVVDLTMHPVNDASLTPNPNPFSLAGGTHSTARTAVVSTFSGDTTLGDAGLKVGFDGGEYKAIIYGRLPEKKDALGETGDANANIVGMKLNFTINNNDTTALHYAISEFDVKLDAGISGTNGYQFTDMARICVDGIDHDATPTAVTQGWFKEVVANKSPLNITDGNFGSIEDNKGPIKSVTGDFGFGANGIIAFFRPDTADVDFSIDMKEFVKSNSLNWGDYFSFIIQRMDNDDTSTAGHITFKQVDSGTTSRKTINGNSSGSADHSTGFDIVIQYEDKEPTRPIIDLKADTDMINAVVDLKTKPTDIDIKELRTVWKKGTPDTVDGVEGVTYTTGGATSVAVTNLGKDSLKEADGDIQSDYLADMGSNNTYQLVTYATDQNSNTMSNLVTHFRLRAAGSVTSNNPTIGEEVTLTVVAYSHSSSATPAEFTKFGVNWDGNATASQDSLDDYTIVELDEPTTSTTLKHTFHKANADTYVNIFVVDSKGFRSDFQRAQDVDVQESNPVAVLRTSRDTALRAKYGDDFSVINLSLSHSYPIGSDREILTYKFKHNAARTSPLTTFPMSNDNSGFKDGSQQIRLTCQNVSNTGPGTPTTLKVFGRVSVMDDGTDVADDQNTFDHYEYKVVELVPNNTKNTAGVNSSEFFKSVDFCVFSEISTNDDANAARYILDDMDGNVINDKLCGGKNNYAWGGFRNLTTGISTLDISNAETLDAGVSEAKFIDNGARVGDTIFINTPENANNNGIYTLSEVTTTRLKVNEDIDTTNADDTTADIITVAGPTLPIASYESGLTPTITCQVVSRKVGDYTTDELDNSSEVTQTITIVSEVIHTLDLDTMVDNGDLAILSANLSRSGGLASRMPLGSRAYPISPTRTSLGLPTMAVSVRTLTQTGYRKIWNLIEGDRYEWSTIDSKKVDSPSTAYKQLRLRLSNGNLNKDPAMANQYVASLNFIVIGELVS
tara:strand:+ start:3946 stop:6822 length:2877 start_codon:yes stop_codon:yes gene_type:complete